MLQPNEPPMSLAKDFCRKHGLPEEVAGVLAREIEGHIAKSSFQSVSMHQKSVHAEPAAANRPVIGSDVPKNRVHSSHSENAENIMIVPGNAEPAKESKSGGNSNSNVLGNEETTKEKERRLKWESRTFQKKKAKVQQGSNIPVQRGTVGKTSSAAKASVNTKSKAKSEDPPCPLSPPTDSIEQAADKEALHGDVAGDSDDLQRADPDEEIKELAARPGSPSAPVASSRPEVKVWDRLFTSSKEKMKAREEYVEQYNKFKAEQEAAQYTYRPEINANSRKMVCRTRG